MSFQITPEVLTFGVGLVSDAVKWFEERKARGQHAAPTNEEVLDRVRGKINASLAEGTAALAVPDAPAPPAAVQLEPGTDLRRATDPAVYPTAPSATPKPPVPAAFPPKVIK